MEAFQKRLSQLPPLPVKRWSDLQKALTILGNAETPIRDLQEQATAFQAEIKALAEAWEEEGGALGREGDGNGKRKAESVTAGSGGNTETQAGFGDG